MRCLITGGAGFIGSHLVGYLLEHTDWEIMVIDLLTYAADRGERLARYQNHPRFRFQQKDICKLEGIKRYQDPDFIVHLAAETHVERSIDDPETFLRTNVMGTYHMLQYARRQNGLKKFLYFSTDEVFGASNHGYSRYEDDPYQSGNPYAATKAAGEELALAWGNTYSLPVAISHCSNVFGPGQHEEKFIPKLVRKILQGEKIHIHASRDGTIGSRMYVHAEDVARAILALLESGKLAYNYNKYNIPGMELSNLEMAEEVACILGKSLHWEKLYPAATRPGWDFAYRISGDRLQQLGWKRSPDFYEKLRETVESYARQTQSQK